VHNHAKFRIFTSYSIQQWECCSWSTERAIIQENEDFIRSWTGGTFC